MRGKRRIYVCVVTLCVCAEREREEERETSGARKCLKDKTPRRTHLFASCSSDIICLRASEHATSETIVIIPEITATVPREPPTMDAICSRVIVGGFVGDWTGAVVGAVGADDGAVVGTV